MIIPTAHLPFKLITASKTITKIAPFNLQNADHHPICTLKFFQAYGNWEITPLPHAKPYIEDKFQFTLDTLFSKN